MKAIIAMATFGIVFIGLIGWYEVSMWNECRQTNSWFYCARILGK